MEVIKVILEGDLLSPLEQSQSGGTSLTGSGWLEHITSEKVISRTARFLSGVVKFNNIKSTSGISMTITYGSFSITTNELQVTDGYASASIVPITNLYSSGISDLLIGQQNAVSVGISIASTSGSGSIMFHESAEGKSHFEIEMYFDITSDTAPRTEPEDPYPDEPSREVIKIVSPTDFKFISATATPNYRCTATWKGFINTGDAPSDAYYKIQYNFKDSLGNIMSSGSDISTVTSYAIRVMNSAATLEARIATNAPSTATIKYEQSDWTDWISVPVDDAFLDSVPSPASVKFEGLAYFPEKPLQVKLSWDLTGDPAKIMQYNVYRGIAQTTRFEFLGSVIINGVNFSITPDTCTFYSDYDILNNCTYYVSTVDYNYKESKLTDLTSVQIIGASNAGFSSNTYRRLPPVLLVSNSLLPDTSSVRFSVNATDPEEQIQLNPNYEYQYEYKILNSFSSKFSDWNSLTSANDLTDNRAVTKLVNYQDRQDQIIAIVFRVKSLSLFNAYYRLDSVTPPSNTTDFDSNYTVSEVYLLSEDSYVPMSQWLEQITSESRIRAAHLNRLLESSELYLSIFHNRDISNELDFVTIDDTILSDSETGWKSAISEISQYLRSESNDNRIPQESSIPRWPSLAIMNNLRDFLLENLLNSYNI